MQQVITIHPDGSMSGLQHKRGKGVDLCQFGRASIERASHILWDEMGQCWFVEILTGPHAGKSLTQSLWSGVTGQAECRLSVSAGVADVAPETVLGFADYDDAVAAEVVFLNSLRLKGTF
jgi:hypothetical protein